MGQAAISEWMDACQALNTSLHVCVLCVLCVLSVCIRVVSAVLAFGPERLAGRPAMSSAAAAIACAQPIRRPGVRHRSGSGGGAVVAVPPVAAALHSENRGGSKASGKKKHCFDVLESPNPSRKVRLMQRSMTRCSDSPTDAPLRSWVACRCKDCWQPPACLM